MIRTIVLAVIAATTALVANVSPSLADAASGSSSGAAVIPTTTSSSASSPYVSTDSRSGVLGSGNSGSNATIYNIAPDRGSSLTVAPTLVYAPSWTTVQAPRPVVCPAVVDVAVALATNLWLDPSCHPMFVQQPPTVTTPATPPVVTTPQPDQPSKPKQPKPESPLY